MTYASLIDLLRQLHTDSYDTAVPAGLTRYIVAHTYGGNSVQAGDRNVWDFLRVQIDVYTQSPEDPLPTLVRELLQAWCCPYLWVDSYYDDETALHRTILQLEVVA